MLQLLLDTELSSTQKDFAQTAQVCGEALITLINEVLDQAKIEANKLELEAVPFDLRLIVDDVLSMFSEKSRQKGVEVSLQTCSNQLYCLSLLYFHPASNLFTTSARKLM